MKGEVGILNVGAGDTKLTFDKSKPEERKRAAAVVKDMLKRGFAILIQVGQDPKDGEPIYRRAKSFDPETCEYIIVGAPDEEEQQAETATESTEKKPRGRRPRLATSRVPAESTRAVSVGRSAGG